MYHEAGYDSYLTARVMILLSAKLEAKGSYVLEDDAAIPRPLTPSGENALGLSPPVSPNKQDASSSLIDALHSGAQLNKTSPQVEMLEQQQLPIRIKTASRFATTTLFEALASSSPPENEGHEQGTGNTVIGTSFALDPTARPFPIAATGDATADTKAEATTAEAKAKGPELSNKGKERPKEKKLKFEPLMPPFNSDFWRVYANKLRVFGTVEGILDLGPARMQ
jgi:poly(A)-specific ribonuclease